MSSYRFNGYNGLPDGCNREVGWLETFLPIRRVRVSLRTKTQISNGEGATNSAMDGGKNENGFERYLGDDDFVWVCRR